MKVSNYNLIQFGNSEFAFFGAVTSVTHFLIFAGKNKAKNEKKRNVYEKALSILLVIIFAFNTLLLSSRGESELKLERLREIVYDEVSEYEAAEAKVKNPKGWDEKYKDRIDDCLREPKNHSWRR